MADSIDKLASSIRELIPALQQLAKAQQVVEKAQEDLQDTVQKTENVFFRMQKTIAGEGEGGMSNAFKTMNKFGYALIPMYFKLKNQVETSLIVFGKFWDGVTGKGKVGLVGGVFRKIRKDVQSAKGLFEKERIEDPKGFGFGTVTKRKTSVGDFLGVTSFTKILKSFNIKNMVAGANKFYKGINKVNLASGLKNLFFVSLVAAKYLLLAVLGISLLIAFLKNKTVQNAFKTIKEILIISFGILKSGFGLIYDGFKRIYEAFTGDGNFFTILYEVFAGVLTIFFGVGKIIFGILFALLGSILTGIVGFLGGLLTSAFSIFGEKASKILYVSTAILFMISGVVLIIIAIKFAVVSLPFVLAGIIISAIGVLLAKINPFAEGGITRQGLSLVGEKGPELVRLPQGSRVYSNSDSRKMLSNGQTNNITVNVQGRIGASDSELRQIAQKVGQMINREINRTTSSRTGA